MSETDSINEQIDQALDRLEKEESLHEKSDDTVSVKKNNSRRLWMYAAMVALIFVILSLPQTYTLTAQVARNLGVQGYLINGAPSVIAVVTHGVVALLLARLLMCTCDL